jgi:hypothetical protein
MAIPETGNGPGAWLTVQEPVNCKRRGLRYRCTVQSRNRVARGDAAGSVPASIFRGSIPHPTHAVLATKRTLLLGPDLHRLDRTSFAGALIAILKEHEAGVTRMFSRSMKPIGARWLNRFDSGAMDDELIYGSIGRAQSLGEVGVNALRSYIDSAKFLKKGKHCMNLIRRRVYFGPSPDWRWTGV